MDKVNVQEKLQQFITKGEDIRERCISYSYVYICGSEYEEWLTSTRIYIKATFGESDEAKRYIKLSQDDNANLATNADRLIGILKSLSLQPELFASEKPISVEALDYSKIFIVHGHDKKLQVEISLLLLKQNIDGIVLMEQPNGGLITIIEKLEKNSNVSYAVILCTPDDQGSVVGGIPMSRARQNVIFEAGYFAGKLGRDRVFLINNGVEDIPSDLSGVISTQESNWKQDFLKELKHAGFSIDMNRLI